MEEYGDNGRIRAPKRDGVNGHEERSRGGSAVQHDAEEAENISVEEGDDRDDKGYSVRDRTEEATVRDQNYSKIKVIFSPSSTYQISLTSLKRCNRPSKSRASSGRCSA